MSPQEQTPIFPVEIIELIIKNVANTHLPFGRTIRHVDDLRRCCLVSKAWVPICQSQMFMSASLDKSRLTRARKRKNIPHAIIEIPHISSYIQKIDYSVGLNDKGLTRGPNTNALLKLPNVKSLQIQKSVARTLDFNRCREKGYGFILFFDAYITSISLTTLTIVRLHNLPLIVIFSCPNVKYLCLSSCTFSDWNPTDQTTTQLSHTSKIEDLLLDNVRKFPYAVLCLLPQLRALSTTGVSWYIPPSIRQEELILPFAKLETLDIYSDSWIALPISEADKLGIKLFDRLKELSGSPTSLDEWEVMARVLKHAPQLRNLELRLMTGEFIPNINLHQHLAQNTGGLQNLTILSYIGDHDLKSMYTIQALSDSLSLLRSPSSLQSLNMEITIQTPLMIGLPGVIRQMKTLDATLFVDTDYPLFPLLKWITINIIVEHGGPADCNPILDDNMKADFYACVDSSFEGFKRSPRSRLDIKVEIYLSTWSDFNLDRDSEDGFTSFGSDDY